MTYLKSFGALVGAAALLVGVANMAHSSQQFSPQVGTSAHSPLIRLAQSQSQRCRNILEQCRARCPASGADRRQCLNRCGEAYESCN